MERSLRLTKHSLEKHKDEHGGQHYYVPTLASYVPSVTTIIKGPRRGSYWSGSYSGELARLRGDEFHRDVEAFLLDEQAVTYTDHFPSLEPFLKRIDDIWLVEGPLWHGDGFAGTVDCIAVVDGELSVIDWKSSDERKSRPSVDAHQMQVAAYRVAAQSVYGITIKRGYVVVAVPYEDAQVFRTEDLDEEYELFRGKLESYRAQAKPFRPSVQAERA